MTKKSLEMLTNEEESLLLFVGMAFATPLEQIIALRKVANRLADALPKEPAPPIAPTSENTEVTENA